MEIIFVRPEFITWQDLSDVAQHTTPSYVTMMTQSTREQRIGNAMRQRKFGVGGEGFRNGRTLQQ